jgi:ABC-2 type transport system permease protein
MFVGIVILLAGVFKMDKGISPAVIPFFLVSLMTALVLAYSILLILSSAAFWYLGTPLIWIFENVMQTGRFPVGVYPGFLRLVLTWIIPVGFIVTVPAEVLTGGPDLCRLGGGAALAAALFAVSSLFFRASLKRYSSASS